ncbi:MAG: DUF1127 domain-containing protein [Rhodospirillales bacterium]
MGQLQQSASGGLQVFGGKGLGGATIFGLLVTGLLRWQDRANERHHLAQMQDHQLRDIGLSRADIDQEARKPFWRS